MNTMTALLKFLFSLSFLVPHLLAQNHTQCVDNGSDWYTGVTGETPCRTYERLRKICNSNYVLGALGPSIPPDTCNDQVADCCCNSIAWGLSMLCLTCQQGIGSSGNGIDAGVGAYQLYLMHGTNSFCAPNTNRSLPNDIQAAVCNNDIKIHNTLYDVFWDTGAWFYTFTRESMEKANAADGNNSFTHCASTYLNATSSLLSQSMTSSQSAQSSMTSLTDSTTTSATSTSTSSQRNSSSNTLGAGAIAGIVVGGIILAGVITLFLLWSCWYRRRGQPVIEDSDTTPRPFSTVHSSDL
ncbi:uncharacterized protein EV420DRAFT_493846 [Desarmillaria tabescens]|uniref:Mid2 domain-containing protein n=1 Tax=Armillaria tabescens TaxID=1929756 RepID=A0AA39KA83_ARMTA|nr:uncharacterized protein EV420DRAFT_493846 [Desarmillaria tabescens]KAK0457439.1 hypothetical protein EV420DRAFT_493846 [Desarmillaria tabescens]